MSEDADTIYLNAAQVRSRYGGMSDMALWRWLRDETLGFPKPLIIRQPALLAGGRADRLGAHARTRW